MDRPGPPPHDAGLRPGVEQRAAHSRTRRSGAPPSGRFRRLVPAWAAARPDLVAVVLLFAFAAATRLVRLGSPPETIPLDEAHYLPDARDILRFGTESDVRSKNGAFVVHPPVGKLFIALGMRIFGPESEFGARFFGALLGALGVIVVYLIGRRLWRSRALAAAAALLLALDGLWFAQSRIAMLDIYVAFFGLLALWLLLEDRARGAPARFGVRWWRTASAAAAGLAIASKWGGLPMAGALALFALAWEWRRRPRTPEAPVLAGAAPGDDPPGGPALPRLRRRWLRLGAAAATFSIVPLIVYVASHAPWFLDDSRYLPPRCAGKAAAPGWLCYQREIYDFHRGLQKVNSAERSCGGKDAKIGEPCHPYFGEVWAWPWIGRPVVHYFESAGEDAAKRDAEVIGLPNPLVWSAGFVVLPPLGWWAVRGARRRPEAADGVAVDPALPGERDDGASAHRRDPVAVLVVVLVLANLLPYLVTGFFGRPSFMFYGTPLVPLFALGVAHWFGRMVWHRPRRRWMLLVYVLGAGLLFAYFYPVLAAVPIAHDGAFGWRGHMWISRWCGGAARIKNFCWI